MQQSMIGPSDGVPATHEYAANLLAAMVNVPSCLDRRSD
jgi:hypothetical protein